MVLKSAVRRDVKPPSRRSIHPIVKFALQFGAVAGGAAIANQQWNNNEERTRQRQLATKHIQKTNEEWDNYQTSHSIWMNELEKYERQKKEYNSLWIATKKDHDAMKNAKSKESHASKDLQAKRKKYYDMG